MASQSFESSALELHQLDIAKPKPLRIVKRSQTISGSPAPQKAILGGRRASGSLDQRDRSPPWDTDRPLTVRKKRQGRGSVLGITFDGPPILSPAPDMLDLGTSSHEPVQGEYDFETTPKTTRPLSRTTGDWGVLEPATFYKEYNINPTKKLVRRARASNSTDLTSTTASVTSSQDMPCGTIPQRRFSRSKSFLLKAIGGRSGRPKDKSCRPAGSGSGNILLRRLSRGRHRKSTLWDSSTSRSTSCTSNQGSLELGSRDVTDISINPLSAKDRVASGAPESSNAHRPEHRANLVLSPQIKVTPEISSVSLGKCSFWVAIEIRGVAGHADGYLYPEDGFVETSTTLITAQALGLSQYGYLHSTRIDLLPAHDSFITEVIGDLSDPNKLYANETRLILARISLGECYVSPSLTRPFSDELLDDLEKHLGDTITTYLTIHFTYKHSGFPDSECPVPPCAGTASHITQLHTNSTAVIRRHDSESVWSPRIPQSINTRITSSPLMAIVEKCLPTDQARMVIRRLASGQRTPQLHQRLWRVSGSGKGGGYCSPFAKAVPTAIDPTVYSSSDIGPAVPGGSDMQSQIGRLEDPFIQSPPPPKIRDPARKIWREMRLSSRGRYGRWGSFNRAHYSTEEDVTPTRKSSSNVTSSTLDTASSGNDMPTIQQKRYDVDDDRSRIREIALRNQRSVGADTLRSIAPSVQRGRTGTMSGLGLGLGIGRTWGWGPSWW